jgi:hypothetical protein
VRKAVQAQEGKISGKQFHRRMEVGKRNGHYSVGKKDRGNGP